MFKLFPEFLVSDIENYLYCGKLIRGKRFFYSRQHLDWLWGPPSLLSKGDGGALFPKVKCPWHEDDYSLPSSAEDKNGGAIHPLPHMSLCIVLNLIN
jgi:hypothetical protein